MIKLGKCIFIVLSVLLWAGANLAAAESALSPRLRVVAKHTAIIPAAGGVLRQPSGVALDSAGRVYITDSLDANVKVYDSAGNYLRTIGKKGTGDGELILPYDLVVLGDELLLVVDLSTYKVQAFDLEGNYRYSFGRPNLQLGAFSLPLAIAVQGDNLVYLVDVENHCVNVFEVDSRSGRFRNRIGNIGPLEGQFMQPADIAVSLQGWIYVTELINCRVQVFDAGGRFKYKFGRAGTRNGDFAQPKGVAVDDQGRIYVSDQINNRVDLFTADGSFTMTLMTGSDGLNAPGKIALKQVGPNSYTLYVVNTNTNEVVAHSFTLGH